MDVETVVLGTLATRVVVSTSKVGYITLTMTSAVLAMLPSSTQSGLLS